MEMAAKVKTGLAFSGLFRVVSILNKNFRDVLTTEEMKPLNNFVDCEIEVLTREAKPDDLVQLMASLRELLAAALKLKGQLDLYEYEQIEKQVNSSSSSDEPIPKEQDLPQHLRMGLNKLLEIVKRVEYIIESITSKKGTTQRDSFVDFLVGESHVPRPVIELAISDISRLIEMLGSEFRSSYQAILEELMHVLRYHIQELIRNVNFHYLAESVQFLDMLQAASLQLDWFKTYELGRTEIEDLFYPGEFDGTKIHDPFDPDEFNLTETQAPFDIDKSLLRIGLKKMLNFIEQAKLNQPSITVWMSTTRPQDCNSTPNLWIAALEKWLKFVEQVEKQTPIYSNHDYFQKEIQKFSFLTDLNLRDFLLPKSNKRKLRTAASG